MADSFEITGTLRQLLPVQSGKSARGEWQKQEFVIEFPDGNFTSSACFNVWGADRVKDLQQFKVGDQVHVWFHISSREFNGRWYTDLRAWRVQAESRQPAGGQAPEGAPQAPYAGRPSDNVPAGFTPAHGAGPATPPPTAEDMPADDSGSDDLPF
jgi:hypothetical protein